MLNKQVRVLVLRAVIPVRVQNAGRPNEWVGAVWWVCIVVLKF
jgi:hypothetical protein